MLWGTKFELHVPTQVLSKHIAAWQDACSGKAAAPWSAWCADVTNTCTPGVFVWEACMITCSMRMVSHLPGWGEHLHVDSYTPRRPCCMPASTQQRNWPCMSQCTVCSCPQPCGGWWMCRVGRHTLLGTMCLERKYAPL